MTNTSNHVALNGTDDEHPVWQDDGVTDVQALFKNPYWVDAAHRTQVGQDWYKYMARRGLFLFDTPGPSPPAQANNVFASGDLIYAKLLPAGDMPIPVANFDGKFPPEALEKFRLWYNDGGRVTKADPLR